MELYTDALTYFNKVLEKDPNNFFSLYSKGVLLLLLGKQKEPLHTLHHSHRDGQLKTTCDAALSYYKEAVAYLSQSLEIDTKNELVFLYRAQAFQLLHEHDKARDDILHAVRLKPDISKNPEAQQLIKQYLIE